MLHHTRAVLRKDTENADGLCQIAIVSTMKGKRKYHSTGLRVLEKQWKNDKVIGHSNAALFNSTIRAKLAEVETDILNGGANNDADFLDYAEKALADFRIVDNTRRLWELYLRQIRAFSPTLSFRDITPQWLYQFERHRLAQGVKPNVARKNFTFMRRVFMEAKRDGTTTLYPFAEYKVKVDPPGPRAYLTMQEINRLEALFKKILQPSSRTILAHFLLECYSGIRHSDWSRWQTERLDKTDNFRLTARKNKEIIYLPLANSPRLRAIVKRIQSEGMQYKGTNQYANRHLKKIGEWAKIDKHLTTHVGRHTAATQLLARGFSRETVAEVLGVSMKVVDVYARMTRQKVKSEFERLGGL